MVKRLGLQETLEKLKLWRESFDEDALTALVLSNQGLVKHFAYKYGNNVISSEDLQSIGNEALIRAIYQFDYINRPIEGFSSYIMVAIEHEISVEFRKNNKHSHVISLNQPLYQAEDGDSINFENIISSDSEKLFEHKLNSNIVREFLNLLTPREREIIILRYGLDRNQPRTLAEIATIFGCTKQAINLIEQKTLRKMHSIWQYGQLDKKIKNQ